MISKTTTSLIFPGQKDGKQIQSGCQVYFCAAEQAWDIALIIPAQKHSLVSPSRSTELLLPETLMWKGIYQAGAQMPNSLPSGSVNCAHLPQGSVLSSFESVTPRALSVSHVASIVSVCKT